MKALPTSRSLQAWWVRVVLAALVGALALMVGSTTAFAGQYYEIAGSGAGTTTGTGAYYHTWSSWSVPESPSRLCTNQSGGYCAAGTEGFTAEAVWLFNGANIDNSIEAGLGSGFASGANGGWTTAMQPYYTTNNGAT